MIRPLAAYAAMLLSFPLFAATPVDVNTADAATLATSLDGIGLSKAQAIVTWRDEHGPFKSLGDLTAVKGVGMALLERNRDAILFEEKPATTMKATRSAKKAKVSKEKDEE